MKKQILTAVAGKVIGLSVLLGLGQIVSAQVAEPTKPTVSYLGEWNNKLLFEVAYTADNEVLQVDISDGEGFSFYTGRFRNSVKQQFALEKDGMEGQTLTFVLNTKKSVNKERFTIHKSYSVTEKLNVVRQGGGLVKN